MCAKLARQAVSAGKRPRLPRASIGEWLRAWREVLKDPDKTIPEPHLPAEGEPIPAELDLHCPECRHTLAGLRERVCPSCGQGFSLKRAYTLKMLRKPEYFLRYRLAPEDIRRILWTIILMTAGCVLIVAANFAYVVTIGNLAGVQVVIGLYGMSWIVGLSIPSLIIIKFALDIHWAHIAFYFSLIWFGTGALLFAVSCL